MNDTDLRAVIGRLEATEALAKLFKNLWFEQVKQEIRNEKVRAYLMVFEDAFPAMNDIAEFALRCADVLSAGTPTPERWALLRSEFAALSERLLERPVALATGGSPMEARPAQGPEPLADLREEDLTEEEKAALESVDQSDIDSLFSGGESEAPADSEDIDALFSDRAGGAEEETEVTEEDVESFLRGEEEEEADDGDATDDAEEVDEAGEGGEAEEPEEVEETEEEVDDDADVEEDVEVEAEAETEGEEGETDEVELADLLADEEEEEEVGGGASISDDEMAALLDEEEEEEEAPPPKAAAKAKPAKPKAKPTDRKTENSGNGEESISEDEIDALFG
jgi:hypothetical protein